MNVNDAKEDYTISSSQMCILVWHCMITCQFFYTKKSTQPTVHYILDSAYCALYYWLSLLCIIYSTLPTVHYIIDSAYTVHYIIDSAYTVHYIYFSPQDLVLLAYLFDLPVVVSYSWWWISLGFTPIHIFITLHSLCVHLGSYMYTVRT